MSPITYVFLAGASLLLIFNLLLFRAHARGKSTRIDRLARPLTARLIAKQLGYSYGYVRETLRIRDRAANHEQEDIETMRAMHRLGEQYPEDHKRAMRKARNQ